MRGTTQAASRGRGVLPSGCHSRCGSVPVLGVVRRVCRGDRRWRCASAGRRAGPGPALGGWGGWSWRTVARSEVHLDRVCPRGVGGVKLQPRRDEPPEHFAQLPGSDDGGGSSPGARWSAFRSAVHKLRPGSSARVIEYGQPGTGQPAGDVDGQDKPAVCSPRQRTRCQREPQPIGVDPARGHTGEEPSVAAAVDGFHHIGLAQALGVTLNLCRPSPPTRAAQRAVGLG